MLGLEYLWDGRSFRKFSKKHIRTKHAEKSRVDLWGQPLILKAAEADCQGLEGLPTEGSDQ